MKHRHRGPKVRYRTRKGFIRYRKRPMHELRLKIPSYAKRAAKRGLELRKKLPKSKKFGLSPEEARKQGIDSGVTRARRIIRNEFMPYWEIKKVARFYHRFKNCKTPKCEGAIDIWGGRRFGRTAIAHVKRIKFKTRR